jgi:hypothetical protein
MVARLSVVVANEPLACREALAAAVRLLRPEILVATIEQVARDRSAPDQSWQVAICSDPTDAIRALASRWVVLYPDGENRACIHVAGRETTCAAPGLADLLAVIDEAGQAAR